MCKEDIALKDSFKSNSYDVNNFSYMIRKEYLDTHIGKYILNNHNIFLYIIKEHLTKYLNFSDEQLKEYLTNNITAHKYLKILNKEQIQNILDTKLNNIDLNNNELKRNAHKLLNLLKIKALPIIGNNVYKTTFKDCKLKTDYDKKHNLRYYINPDKAKSICKEENIAYNKNNVNKLIDENLLKANEFEVKYKNPIKCIFYLAQSIKQLNTTSNETYKEDFYNLKYNLEQYNKILNYVKNGFSLKNSELTDFLNKIKQYNLGEHFRGCPEAQPYMNYIT